MSSDDIKNLLAALRTGELTLDEVVSLFRQRAWARSKVAPPQSYAELADAAQVDPGANVPGSFDEVTAAYDRGEIPREQYRALAHAAAEAINAQAQRERDARGG